ncbi:Tfb4-domain-containing protein [Meredithblackwellia eburnea MCA 4105]
MSSTATDTPGDLLCLILDLNPVAWSLANKAKDEDEDDNLSLESALDQVLIFCNAHLALQHENELAVFAAGFGKSRMLFSSQLTPLGSSVASTSSLRDSNTYQQFRMVDERLVTGVKEVMSVLPDEGAEATVGLVGALAMALCHVNRLEATDAMSSTVSKAKPRICVLSVTEDASSQYVPIMNCIFSAQKKSIPIDVCKIYGPDAVFLQQACHLTNGSYYKLARRSGLLQYLMMAFLPGASARKHLNLPTQEQVDLRAACFCHRRIVDIGYVCSVCLSIFCAPIPVCTTCRTKFPMATLKRLGMGSRPPGGPGGANGGPMRPKKRKADGTGTPGPSTPGSRASTPRPTPPAPTPS